jgi:hypothetical protein
MSKFEQLLDLIVNEEMDKANELFHEIVVEKSRDIYENLIAEEAEEEMDEAKDEDMDESADDEVDESADEEMDESADEDMDESADEEMDESEMDLEDSFELEGDDEPEAGGLEKADDLEGDIEMDGGEGGDDEAMFDIKNAIAELEAAFEKLEAAQGGDMGAEFGDETGDMGDEEDDIKMGMYEGRRITREYREKVGNDWEKNSMKTQGQYVGAGTGDKEGAPVEGRSPIASGANKPGPAGVNAKNLNQSAHEGGTPTGTSPGKVNKGINPESGEKFASGIHNVDGKKSGVKTLSNVKGGHGAEKKGAGPGPVGSGTGDKAGQTSIDPATSKQFLKPYSK